MTQKQQTLINLLNKYVRQYFLYEEPKTERRKVLLRNDVLYLDSKPEDAEVRRQLLEQRNKNNHIGQMTPHYLPFSPVSSWPVLRLEELVLNALKGQLDSKVWQALKSHFEKGEVKRLIERKDLGAALKDLTVVFKCQSAGYNRIKAHTAETEARMHNVKAGFDFQQHLTRTIAERHRREAPKDHGVQKLSADPDIVVAMQRVRNDTVKFLATVLDILEKILLIKLRHLRSPVPIVLQNLGTEKDRENLRQTDRVLQYPGGPPVTFSFKELIIAEAPPGWPLMSKYSKKPLRGGLDPMNPHHSRLSVASRSAMSEDVRAGKKPNIEKGSVVWSQSSTLTQLGDRDDLNKAFQDKDMMEAFRKRWPPVWISLAAMEQGCNIVDPQCPTKEQHGMNQNSNLPRRKSMTNVLTTRQEWADLRQDLDQSVKETLWREDKERLDFFHKQYASLSHLPLSKPYPTHSRYMKHLLAQTRTRRQKKTIYDCELSKWYKYLVTKVQEEVGKCDEEANQLLEKVKYHFKMSPTSPRYGKAKLALITMSIPAHVLTQIHVQRALRFILCHVMLCPEQMLIGWLAIRGLPFMVIPSHVV